MNSIVDGGPIISTYEIKIDKKETGWSLYNKMIHEIPDMLDQFSLIYSSSINVLNQNEKNVIIFQIYS